MAAGTKRYVLGTLAVQSYSDTKDAMGYLRLLCLAFAVPLHANFLAALVCDSADSSTEDTGTWK